MDLAYTWGVPVVDRGLSVVVECLDCGRAQVVNEDLHEAR